MDNFDLVRASSSTKTAFLFFIVNRATATITEQRDEKFKNAEGAKQSVVAGEETGAELENAKTT